MRAKDLSILIPARNEEFLSRTIQDILENIEADTEVIAVLDGEWANPPVEQHPQVNVVYLPKSIGQRAATNLACRLSKAKYVMKVDAHCAFDKGFDRKLIEDMQDDWTVVPTMRNLHAFNWVCKCSVETYQDKGSTCPGCGATMEKKMIWEPRRGTRNYSYCFDSEPHFNYFSDYRNREDFKEGAIIGYNLSFTPSLIASDLLTKGVSSALVGAQPSSLASVVSLLTNFANSHQFPSGADFLRSRKNVSVDAVSLPAVDGGRSVRTSEVLGVGDEFKMEGVATSPILTEVVENRDILPSSSGDTLNKPGVKETMRHFVISEIGAVTITTFVDSTSPVPTTSKRINSEVVDELNSILGGEFVYNEKSGSYHNGSVALNLIRNKELTETMSLQGSAFMLTRDKYWELNICDENFGSWGSQGIEVAVKTWLSGGKVIVNHKTWYAHMFRTKAANGFGFPYHLSGKQVQEAKTMARDLFFNNKWDKAVHPLSWLVEKFMPIPGWTQADLDELKKKEVV